MIDNISILNKTFDRLTVLQYSDIKIGNRPTLICKCSCGKENVLVQRKKLLSGHTKSCGCLQKEIRESHLDLREKVFDRLKVIKATEQRDRHGCIIWECECICGEKTYVSTTELTSGNTKSCGCLHLENGYASANSENVFEHFDKTCITIIKNKRPNKNSKSKIKGVYKGNKRNKYVATIMFKKVRYFLGRFDTQEEAAGVRKTAEERLHDSFVDWYYKNKQFLKNTTDINE